VKHTLRSSKALCIVEPAEVDGLSKPFCERRLLHFECDGALLSGSLEGSTWDRHGIGDLLEVFRKFWTFTCTKWRSRPATYFSGDGDCPWLWECQFPCLLDVFRTLTYSMFAFRVGLKLLWRILRDVVSSMKLLSSGKLPITDGSMLSTFE